MSESIIRGENEVVGLVPAAGQGKRIAPLPLSKELYPIGFQIIDGEKTPKPKVVSHYLLEKFRYAGITKAFIVLREGKWDIPSYFGAGEMLDMHLAYLTIRDSCGPPFTIDKAFPFIKNRLIAFGFPDILFGPDDVFIQLLNCQTTKNSDLVLGLFPAQVPQEMDMVEVEENGKVRNMLLKPTQTHLTYSWLCAIWTPVFTQFMHTYLQDVRSKGMSEVQTRKIDAQGDLPVGAVIKASIQQGLRVDGVKFPKGTYIDIGRPDDLVKAIENYGDYQ